MKLTTLCYPVKDGQVLLAMKKRGFGTGKWNGPGGKVIEGELVEEACRREVLEETGILVGKLEPRGIIEFVFEGKSEDGQECHVFVTDDIRGEITETEEMKPQWFLLGEVPYQDMWEDDSIWLSGVLNGGRVNKRFYFDREMKMLRNEDM
ncbi:MAG: 8-oxo-dGTP diphosphatase [Patescibacteria group bacterium]